MGIKVIGVPGQKILSNDETRTQDFVMIHHDVFFVKNASDYVKFQRSPLRFAFSRILDEGRIFFQVGFKKITNPLESRYWSMTPYSLGKAPGGRVQAMKYSAEPVSCDGNPVKPIGGKGRDFLRDAMAKTVQARDVCFRFMVQLQRDPVKNPIEDPTISWRESESPFIPVAWIRISRSENAGRTGESNLRRKEFCENIAISPWHALPEHRPLGGINRVRRVVYETVSRFRREANGVKSFEPTGYEEF